MSAVSWPIPMLLRRLNSARIAAKSGASRRASGRRPDTRPYSRSCNPSASRPAGNGTPEPPAPRVAATRSPPRPTARTHCRSRVASGRTRTASAAPVQARSRPPRRRHRELHPGKGPLTGLAAATRPTLPIEPRPAFAIKSEPCSPSFGIGVHDALEYALFPFALVQASLPSPPDQSVPDRLRGSAASVATSAAVVSFWTWHGREHPWRGLRSQLVRDLVRMHRPPLRGHSPAVRMPSSVMLRTRARPALLHPLP